MSAPATPDTILAKTADNAGSTPTSLHAEQSGPCRRGRRDDWPRWSGSIPALLSILLGALTVGLFCRQVVRTRLDRVPEVDCQGYFLMGESFSRLQWPRWNDDFARYRDHVFVDVAGGKVMSKYPPGYPLLLAIGYRTGGLMGALWVSRIVGMIGAAAFFLLAMELFNSTVAFICTALWLFSPMLVMEVGYPYSHGSDITFVLLAFLFTVYWAKYRWTWIAPLAGFCAGFVPLIRPTSILMWPAIALLAAITLGHRPAVKQETGRLRRRALRWMGRMIKGVGWQRLSMQPCRRCVPWAIWLALAMLLLGLYQLAARMRGDVRKYRFGLPLRRPYLGLLLWAAALALPLAFLAWYNHASFGGALRTGYAVTGEQGDFDWTGASSRMGQILNIRREMLPDVCWTLILLGVIFRSRRTGLMSVMLLWLVPTVAVYLGYYFFVPNGAFLRFFLSALPAAILCIGFLLTLGPLRRPFFQLAMLCAFIAWVYYDNPLTVAEHAPKQLSAHFAWITAPPPKAENDELTPLVDYLAVHPAAVYGTGATMWTASADPGSIGYDLNSWSKYSSYHFFRSAMQPRGDPVRFRQINAWLATQDSNSLDRNFLQHVHDDYAAGLAVLVAAHAGDSHLSLLRRDGWMAQQIMTIWPSEERASALPVWHIEPKPATTKPAAARVAAATKPAAATGNPAATKPAARAPAATRPGAATKPASPQD